jgi:uncharacterized protein YbjT (DUF2867 family)
LITAFRGFDVLVILAGFEAFAAQTLFIDAAVEAGVKHVIPTEFGFDTTHPKIQHLKVLQDKIRTRKYLEQLASEGKLTWSGVSNGAWVDWGLENGFLGIRLKEGKAVMYDGGERSFTATILKDVGKAVVGLLEKPEETKNRLSYVATGKYTGKDMLEAAEKVTGRKFEVEKVDTVTHMQEAYQKLEKGDNQGFLVGEIQATLYGEERGQDVSHKLDNELFGIEMKGKEFLEEIIRGILGKA